MKSFNLKFTPAYLVNYFAEIEHGYCSEICKENDWGTEKVLWTKDKLHFSFETLRNSTLTYTGVYLDLKKAQKAVECQWKKRKEYLEKDIKEKTLELKRLQ